MPWRLGMDMKVHNLPPNGYEGPQLTTKWIWRATTYHQMDMKGYNLLPNGYEGPQLNTKWRWAKSPVPYWSCNPGYYSVPWRFKSSAMWPCHGWVVFYILEKTARSTPWHHLIRDFDLQRHHCENLKSCMWYHILLHKFQWLSVCRKRSHWAACNQLLHTLNWNMACLPASHQYVPEMMPSISLSTKLPR
jgi:hypothetical protein